jgi:hypothetical protein
MYSSESKVNWACPETRINYVCSAKEFNNNLIPPWGYVKLVTLGLEVTNGTQELARLKQHTRVAFASY